MKQFLDLSHTIENGLLVFPGDSTPVIKKNSPAYDNTFTTYEFETNFHVGTHIDTPLHASNDNVTIDQYPISLFTGKTAVIDVCGSNIVKMQEKWLPLFKSNNIILFHTAHSKLWNTRKYFSDYPTFDSEIALALKESGVRMVGFDSPSPDYSPFLFHKTFLQSQHFILENLTNLDKLLTHENITLYAFPLKIAAEASLARVVAEI